MARLAAWRARARALRDLAATVWYAARDPRTPWPVRLLAIAVAAYAVSPIDLIPDFIPVLGLLDDLVLLPLGIALVVRLTPPDVIADARARAQAMPTGSGRLAAIAIVVVWLAAIALAVVAVRGWAGAS